MNLQQFFNFYLQHLEILGMIKGGEIVAAPIALILGFLSRNTIFGKIGLSLTGILLLIALYTCFFGLPIPIKALPGTTHL